MDMTFYKRCNRNSFTSLRTFSDPVLHKTKKWYIDFKAVDPATGVMKRKKYYIKDIQNKKKRSLLASEMLSFFIVMLHEGWNPWGANDYNRCMEEFAKCMELYLVQISKMERDKTKGSYASKAHVLMEYICKMEKPIVLAYQFDTSFCSGFLDYIFIERDNTARTRNNYRDWLCTFSNFMVQHGFLTYNPVDMIGDLKEEETYRKDLSAEMLHKLSKHLKDTDKFFYLACMMEYYTMIRPNELSHIKIGDINVKQQKVFVSKDISKSGRDDSVALNRRIIKLMIDLEVLFKPTDYYLFSNDCMPGINHIQADQFTHRWDKVRKVFGWSDHYQFYSLKYSGLRDLANAEGAVVARDQARHVDISTTNIYIKHKAVRNEAKSFKGEL